MAIKSQLVSGDSSGEQLCMASEGWPKNKVVSKLRFCGPTSLMSVLAVNT
jgi:hypothetical protein